MKVKFRNLEVEILKETLLENCISINFGGEMMIQFQRNNQNQFVAINGMDGWGNNNAEEVIGEILLIKVN